MMIDMDELQKRLDNLDRESIVNGYELAITDMWEFINANVWPLVKRLGPAYAAALIGAEGIDLIRADGSTMEASTAMLGLALVEMAMGMPSCSMCYGGDEVTS